MINKEPQHNSCGFFSYGTEKAPLSERFFILRFVPISRILYLCLAAQATTIYLAPTLLLGSSDSLFFTEAGRARSCTEVRV